MCTNTEIEICTNSCTDADVHICIYPEIDWVLYLSAVCANQSATNLTRIVKNFSFHRDTCTNTVQSSNTEKDKCTKTPIEKCTNTNFSAVCANRSALTVTHIVWNFS